MLNRLFICAFFLLLTAYVRGQAAREHVFFTREQPDKKRFNTKDSTLAFPVFRFKEASLSNAINKTLKNEFANFYELKKTLPIRDLLKGAAEAGLVEMRYEELRNDSKILSFCMGSEVMAAYPTFLETTYAFSKSSGNLLTLDCLVIESKRTAFIALLRSMQKDSIVKYREEMVIELKAGEIAQEDYNYVMKKTDSACWENFDPKYFKLYQDRIEIIIDCEYPRIYLPLSPPSVLTIEMGVLKEYIKPAYLDQSYGIN